MSNRHETYLNQTALHLQSLPVQVREAELREIESHLEQLSDDLRARGHQDAQAASLAQARFGSPRSVGLRLRDVWEGNHSALSTALLVFATNWLLSIASVFLLMRFLVVPAFLNGVLAEPLRPLTTACFVGLYTALPFGCNFVLGSWAGRRVFLIAPMVYLPWLLVRLVTYNLDHTITAMIAAAAGAWLGSTIQRRQRMALIGGAPLEQAAVLLAKPRPLRNRLRLAASILLVVTVVGGCAWAWTAARIDAALHPSTPEAAVRVVLAAPGFNPDEMLPAEGVSLRLLPGDSNPNVRHVAYWATMKATPNFRKRRSEFLQRQLSAALSGKNPSFPVKSLRASLARLGPDGHVVQGVARVVKGPKGWTWDTSGTEQPPWAWLYAVGD